MQSGLDLDAAWRRIDELDNAIEKRITYGFQEQIGYLTACPTKRWYWSSRQCHGALTGIGNHQANRESLSIAPKDQYRGRGLFGEGSQFSGDFYQISNQITLGKSETDLVKQVCDIVPRLIDYERKARDFLVHESEQDLQTTSVAH